MIDVFWIPICLAGFWGIGCAVALSLAGPRLVSTPTNGVGILVARAELIGLGWVLGIAVTSYLQFVWSLAGGKLGHLCSLTFAVGGVLIGLLAIWRSRGALATASSQGAPLRPITHLAAEADKLKNNARLAQFCAMLVLGLISIAMIQTLLSPQKFWDERAFYGLKAIVLFQDHSIGSADLANADFVQGHPRYPLLIPLAEQHVYALLGRVDDRLSKLIFPLLFVGLIFTFAGVLTRHLSYGTAWLCGLLLATTPVLMPDDYGFLSGQADAPVACFEGMALLYLWDSLASARAGTTSTWRASLFLAALFGAMVAFTKDEGISHGLIRTSAFACAMLVGTIFHRKSRSDSGAALRFSIREWIIAACALAIIPALILTPWFLHRRHLPLTGEMSYFSRLNFESLWNGLPTLKWSVPHMIERMFGEATIWGLQWWFVAVTLILFPKRALRPSQLFVLMTLTLDIAALLLAGMIAPVTLEEHIGGSSHRYLMQLAPGAVLFAIGQIWNREPPECRR